MAKFNGNIFNRASGSIGGNTFSQARGRQGKVQTARQRVAPFNPKTPAQQNQRNLLKDAVNIVRVVPEPRRSIVWDRAVSKLPAYQSLMSIFQNARRIEGSDIVAFSEPAKIYRGDLPSVAFTGISHSGGGEYEVNFSASPPNQSPTADLVLGGITRVFPISQVGSFRTQETVFPNNPSSPIYLDFGGFPGDLSGVLLYGYYAETPVTSRADVSDISWSLYEV